MRTSRISQRATFATLALMICTFLGAAGCLGLSQNPSRFPYLLPTGDIIRTHAKPPGHGYFADFDPSIARVEVRPLVTTRPVGTEQVYIATVYDADGQPRRKRRVEWLLEGAGHIIEVDESGYFAGRGYKVDNRYAVSYTDFKEHLITRGNNDPTDDFMIRPGQTWCVVSSAVEGDTAMTVYVPAIADWDRNRVVVHTRWVNARCEFPAGAILPAGRDHTLSSRVFRGTDQRPLPGYQVRYRIIDGPPVVLLPPGATGKEGGVADISLTSGPEGDAAVRVVPLSDEPGVARVAVEMIKPGENGEDAKVIARGESRLEWRSAKLEMELHMTDTLPINGETSAQIAVVNRGEVASESLTAWVNLPAELELVQAEPMARVDQGRAVWRLSPLSGGQQHLIQATFRASRPGAGRLAAFARTDDDRRADTSLAINVTVPRLEVTTEVPESSVVGETVPVLVRVRNAGTGPISGVRLRVGHDEGLTHASNRNPIEEKLDDLAPDQIREVTVPLRVREEGTWPVRASVIGSGNLSATAPITNIRAQQARLELRVSGTPRVYLGQTIDWTLRVQNAGKIQLENVTVQAQMPPEVEYLRADAAGRLVNGKVQWAIPTLPPGKIQELHLTGTARMLTDRATLTCDASALPLLPGRGGVRIAEADPTQGLHQRAGASVEILGVPSLEMEVFDLKDPVSVGESTTYRIMVRNRGTLPIEDVVVRAELPNQVRVERAFSRREPKFAGNTVTFAPEEILKPGDEFQYEIVVSVLAAGDARFRAEASSRSLPNPVRAEEATRLLSPSR